MDELVYVLGILGAYFAVLLVLAVAVETILEPFKFFRGLRKRISPEQAMKDIQGWLPKEADENEKAKATVAAIANFTQEFDVKVADLEARVGEIDAVAKETAQALGLGDELVELEKKLAVTVSAIRAKYTLDEQKRITILRVVSAIIGIVIALILQVNTFELLAELFPQGVQETFDSTLAEIGGMVLTGLAASAGSSFWHDQLGKVRALKETQQATEATG